jgi:uncharacterized protein (DUF924 family)
MAVPDDVLEYWFADAASSPEATRDRNEFWFGNNPKTDSEIWEIFADVIADAAAGNIYDDWGETGLGRLALIILLDQFPRNIYRGTSEVFKYDERALALCGQGVTLGQLAGLTVPEQAFFLMPYQHSEDISVQRIGLQLMRAMANEAPQEWQSVAQSYLDYAVRHHDIVAAYGRFPHRNSLLGRSSTEAESEFLAEGGETFGQAG